MEMASFIRGVRLNAIGSDQTAESRFMVTEALPLKVNGVIVEAVMALLPVETAIFALFIVTAPLL